MKRALISLALVALFAGAYWQEVYGSSRKPEDGSKGPAASHREESATWGALGGLRAKVSLLDQTLSERRRDFDKVVFDPIAAPEAGPGASREGADEAARAQRLPLSLKRVGRSQVEGSGEVAVILEGSASAGNRQKFMVRLESGAIVLIDHDAGVAPRVEPLELGDDVAFCGEHSYDLDGNVIRWTHRDPAGRHAPGWIRHKGRTYE